LNSLFEGNTHETRKESLREEQQGPVEAETYPEEENAEEGRGSAQTGA
jgi:hypothetical protein